MAKKLTREAIARAGLRLLDAGGIDAITTRALAAELGVQSPTLYWHVKSKREILRAMAVAMSADAAATVTAADRRAPWQHILTSWASALRAAMLGHRDGGQAFAGFLASDPATFEITESFLQALYDAGASTDLAPQCAMLVRHFVVGFCVEEQALAELQNGADHPRDSIAAADPTRYPLSARGLRAITATGQDQRFQLALRITVAGLTALMDEERQKASGKAVSSGFGQGEQRGRGDCITEGTQ
ncbi:TetR/AcrR family transcriptional regulator C-terminal domain-containing protein [Nocardia sp. CA2R105]|uniref:TetR/AcrR family transcriptional regulator C-terminal domain-containing protein n=1 Tax=Nocardia coffeae TaxID=2873381 RepID=UPI001CA6B32B|nr:TetR/AcrR family transcriptional regulator C-terminal domain-containing protein [Nocardia coffeae]MBY8862238.1 TetR/AcrR family transcriptional regulator C-terminal domain-containing protein [Nocardia coffeae]